MKNCILIHGAWHGAWIWKDLIGSIKKLGYENIIAPDLPGHGTNNSWNFKDITLNKYVDHIMQIVQSLSEPVLLVGHSMAGVIISQVAENLPSRVAQLVYVSGFIADNHGSLIDEEQNAKLPSVALAVTIDQQQSSISINDPKKIRELFYNSCADIDAEYALSKFRAQPLLPFLGKLSISETNFGKVPKLYIECLRDRAINIVDQRRMHSKISCRVESVDSDHSPFFSAKGQLVELIATI